MKETFEEICPYCDYVNEFPSQYKVLQCQDCGEDILPCNMCPLPTCIDCPFPEKE